MALGEKPRVRLQHTSRLHHPSRLQGSAWILVGWTWRRNLAENEPRRLRSTSKTPEVTQDLAPPRLWSSYGVGSAGSCADEEDNSEPTDLEARSTIAKLLRGSPQKDPNDFGGEKSPRGCGSARLLAALRFRQAQLEVPAACASQGAMDSLWNAVPATGCEPKISRLFLRVS